MKLLIMQCLQPPVTSSLFDANILLSTPFSHTLGREVVQPGFVDVSHVFIMRSFVTD
jgi:hypothetical protein